MSSENVKDVVILAGGKGTRMRELTESLPKPMVRIGERPVLDHLIEIFDTFGKFNYFICTGYRSEIIEDYYKSNSKELLSKLKSLSEWSGRPIYIPKSGLKIIAPLGDFYKLASNSTPLICSESARVLTHGHIYDGSKAGDKLNINYIDLAMFMKKTINWLIDESYVNLKKI